MSDYALNGKRVWVAGHRGMVGSAIVRRLASENCTVLKATHAELDLTRQADVEAWMAREKPEAIFVASAVVGGILANSTRPVDFLTNNLLIQTNIIDTAHKLGVEKLIFLGSSCIYPRMAPQPMPESVLLTGPLEPTNQWYAIAKISGIMQCRAYRQQYGRDYISAMPTNLYGPGDNYDLQGSHVLPALMVKAHRAKLAGDAEMVVWGSGQPRREFLYVDDLADACVFLLKTYSGDEHVNVGYGSDVTIGEVAQIVADTVGFKGKLVFDTSKPDGMPKKLVDSGKLNALGWKPTTELKAGIAKAYDWYVRNAA